MNLIKTGDLVAEDADEDEIDSLIDSATNKLRDAELQGLSIYSQFGLAYDACYAFSLAAMRKHGYRAKNRYMVFQCLSHTTDLDSAQIRVLSDAHNKRNRSAYEGGYVPDEATVRAVVRVGKLLSASIE
jgi:hypothetical protein